MKLTEKVFMHLSRADEVLGGLVARHWDDEMVAMRNIENYFERLCESIVSQQLSVKAADTIWGRVMVLVDNEFVPEKVLAVADEKWREAGLSGAKTRYVKGIAEEVVAGRFEFERLKNLSDSEAIEQLVTLKGVGRWTAEMFCMFTLNRTDIFSVGDLGLRRAMERAYGLSDPSNEELVMIAQKWSPFRTVACRVLWRSLDNTPNI